MCRLALCLTRNLVGKIPPWFPGAEFQRLAKRCRELSPKVRDGPFEFVKESLVSIVTSRFLICILSVHGRRRILKTIQWLRSF